MARVSYGGMDSFSAIVGRPMTRQMSEFISEGNRKALSLLNEAGSRFFRSTRDWYSRVRYSEVEHLRDVSNRLRHKLTLEDDIRELTTLDTFSVAMPRMRRWLRAEPTIRNKIRKRYLQGWEEHELIPERDTYYYDEDEGTNADYRYIMNGVLKDDEFVEWIDLEMEKLEEQEQLSEFDRFDIILSWRRAMHYINNEKVDPTSLFGSKLD